MKTMTNIDVSDVAVISCLISSFPPKLRGLKGRTLTISELNRDIYDS